MKHEDFNQFLAEEVLLHIEEVLASKSADYSSNDDKLFNFKLAAMLEGVIPVEALRGMDLKHRTSIAQGVQELKEGKCRDYKWWQEKIIDHINYSILLLGMIKSGEWK